MDGQLRRTSVRSRNGEGAARSRLEDTRLLVFAEEPEDPPRSARSLARSQGEAPVPGGKHSRY